MDLNRVLAHCFKFSQVDASLCKNYGRFIIVKFFTYYLHKTFLSNQSTSRLLIVSIPADSAPLISCYPGLGLDFSDRCRGEPLVYVSAKPMSQQVLDRHFGTIDAAISLWFGLFIISSFSSHFKLNISAVCFNKEIWFRNFRYFCRDVLGLMRLVSHHRMSFIT